MKRIEKVIERLEKGNINKDELLEELNTIKNLIENVEGHLKSLKESAEESWGEESDAGSLSRSIAYETALELLIINMEEGE